MVLITASAREILRTLLREHPEEKVVRFSVADVDDERLAIQITLEHEPNPDDHVQPDASFPIAIAANSLQRLDGVTVDYADGQFRFEHPSPPLKELRLISPN